MLNILINAYAVAPNWGSEQGMAWNWIINISKHCRCFVITEGEWKKEIEDALKDIPQKDNIKFYYNPVSERIRKMCWNQGDWRFYYYYHIWQKKTLKIGKQICKEYSIDIIHQLNMVGFREPGLLWKIKEIPYVWGPVGGMENIPIVFMNNSGIKTKLFALLKNCINTLQYRYQPNIHKAIKSSNIIISAVTGVEKILKKRYNKRTILIPETGINQDCIPIQELTNKESFDILWVGRFIHTKKLDLALKTIANIKHLDKIKIHIVGFGVNNEETKYKKLAKDYGIENKCIWYGKLTNKDVHFLMQKMDILFFTSIMEATSTVVLEAIQNRLPIVCHDTCGFGCIINDSIGRKIELEYPQNSINNFSKIIEELYNNRTLLEKMKPNFDKIAKELTYEAKANKIIEIYNNIANSNTSKEVSKI